MDLHELPSKQLCVFFCRFPPGVGAIGTAALLNVPKSIERVLLHLKRTGYNLGDMPDGIDGENIVTYLKEVAQEGIVSRGIEHVRKVMSESDILKSLGGNVDGSNISSIKLKEFLMFDEAWGPNEWGPMPFLPAPDVLVKKMEKAWGSLDKYRSGLSTSIRGEAVVSGLRFGNVFIGVQPLLGIEGDPMRLLFERDLTPHPQYAAFYKWLEVRYLCTIQIMASKFYYDL